MSRLMMISQILLVLMFFKGIEVEANPPERCLQMMKFHEQIDTFVKLDNEEQLNLFCTNSTNFFTCINEMMKEQTGFTVRELANHWLMRGTSSGIFLTSLVKLEDYTKDMCKNKTKLEMDFMKEVPCIQGGYIKNVPIKHCKDQSIIAYLLFTELGTGRELTAVDNECIVTAYQFGCVATTLYEECGVDAFNKYKDISKRIGFTQNGTCSSELMHTLKTTFLENLNMSETQKRLYRAILDAKRRRR